MVAWQAAMSQAPAAYGLLQAPSLRPAVARPPTRPLSSRPPQAAPTSTPRCSAAWTGCTTPSGPTLTSCWWAAQHSTASRSTCTLAPGRLHPHCGVLRRPAPCAPLLAAARARKIYQGRAAGLCPGLFAHCSLTPLPPITGLSPLPPSLAQVSDGELRQPSPEIMRKLAGAKDKLGLRVHGLILGR